MNIKPNKKNIRERIKARQNTVQALYQWLITNKDLDEVISRAIDSGITQMVCVGTNIKSSEKVTEVLRSFKYKIIN